MCRRWDIPPLERPSRRSGRLTGNLEGIVRCGRSKLVSLGAGVSQGSSIDEELRRSDGERQRHGVRMAVGAAQGSVGTRIDHGDGIFGAPAITKDCDATVREIHVAPPWTYAGHPDQPIGLLDST